MSKRVLYTGSSLLTDVWERQGVFSSKLEDGIFNIVSEDLAVVQEILQVM